MATSSTTVAQTILPDPAQLHLITLMTTAQGMTAVVETKASAVPCPVGGHLAIRRHSRYTRSVADMPWHGVPFHLEAHVRRFFCDHAACGRQIFTARLPGVLAPYARRTVRLDARAACSRLCRGRQRGRPAPAGSCKRWAGPIRARIRWRG